MRDFDAFAKAMRILVRQAIKAFRRNAHKKDLAQEPPGVLWDTLREKVDEAHDAWLKIETDGVERFLEKAGDVVVPLVGLILQGAHHLKQ